MPDKVYLDANGNPTSAPRSSGKTYLDDNGNAIPPAGQSWYDRNIKGTLSGTAGWQQAIDKAATPPEIHGAGDVAGALGAGATQIFGSPVAHPLQTAAGLGRTVLAGLGDTQAQVDVGRQMVEPFVRNPSGSAVAAIPQVVMAVAGTDNPASNTVSNGVDVAKTAIRDAALGDPNAAALRGLHVSPQSPKAQATLNAVQGSRPFLEGVQGLQDLQNRVPVAKQEIWQPYQDALDKIGDNKVKGPDGQITTVQDLENRRLELSAQLRVLRNGGPEAVALAQQKGLTQAGLLREESQVKMALDPQLRSAGIDPVAIRKAFGQVSTIGGKVAGKTTVGEANQPSGFGRMTNVQLDTPRTWIGEPVQGLRDLAAGRPLWSANPTDMNIREAFRMGGQMPDFTTPAQPAPAIAGFLPAQAGGKIPLMAPDPGMTPGEYVAALRQQALQRFQKALPAQATPFQLPDKF